ncbi:DUF6468 domain-containing protein [Methylobrevis albus]|uniref:Chemotaxis protein n=1 Tax=Methylobrevis albus TaxID=2793297 RepID=A0A931MWF6_9HYPH|nr:DUF6468 domain-containing protein [Methylobrevis albus]MBH0236873.1 chemotaxis protein [Methylobrevis albus]
MTGFTLGLAIEIVVALLLVTTIGYCFVLNKRLVRLRADENVLRATIGELITATEIAERAILGLKAAAADCDQTLGRRLTAAEGVCAALDRRLEAGSDVVRRISAIAIAAEQRAPAAAAPVAPAPVAVASEAPAPVQEAGARGLQQAAAEAAERLAAFRRPRQGAAA